MDIPSKGGNISIDPSLLSVRPARPAKPVHEDITPEGISALVDNFYEAVRQQERLGPLFDEKAAGDWEPHLARMKSFWRSVLLKAGEYHGQPVPKHMVILRLGSDDFQIWLDLFREHVHAAFEDDAAALVIQAAERIAQSLWLAKFGTLSNTVPPWIESAGSADRKTWNMEC